LNIFKENTKVLRITGNDRKDFFNRVSTNDFRKFSEGEVIRTVFTNDKGRIVDFAPVLNLQNEFLVLCSGGNTGNLLEFINKYTVVDDITAEELMFSVMTIYEDKIDSPLYNGLSDNIYRNEDGNIFIKDDYGFRKVFVILKNPGSESITELSKNNEQVSESDFKLNAIRNCYLYTNRELNQELNPLECNLKEFVSFTKGCYIGQEVISRLDSQSKVQKQITGVKSKIPFKETDKIFSEEGNECGFITTAVNSDGMYEGLGFIKKSELEVSKKLYLNNIKEQILVIKIF